MEWLIYLYSIVSCIVVIDVISAAPNPVKLIDHHLDSQNITFEWPRPEGRIDFYTIIWWNDLTPNKKVCDEMDVTVYFCYIDMR